MAVHYPERLPSQGWFRLLTIQWSPPGEPLACRLDTHRIQPVPFYDAILYTWGDEAADATITINCRPFLIRKNLHSALLALKNAHRHIIWVDAVCINQADEEERTAQVWQMKQIYSDAQSVKVWLGDATTTAYRGLTFLRRFQRITSECTERHIKSIDDFRICFGDVLTPFREGDEATHLGLQEAFRLLKHPWWTRVWTLQESVMGKQVDCQCGYGTKSVPFACFAKLAWFTYFAVNFGVWSGHEIDSSVALLLRSPQPHVAICGFAWVQGYLDPFAPWPRFREINPFSSLCGASFATVMSPALDVMIPTSRTPIYNA